MTPAALGALSTAGAAFAHPWAHRSSADLVRVRTVELAGAARLSEPYSLDGLASRGHLERSGPDLAMASSARLVALEDLHVLGRSNELRVQDRHRVAEVTEADEVWFRGGGSQEAKVFSSIRREWTLGAGQRSTLGDVGPVGLELEPGVRKIESCSGSQWGTIDRGQLRSRDPRWVNHPSVLASKFPSAPRARLDDGPRATHSPLARPLEGSGTRRGEYGRRGQGARRPPA